MATQIKDGGSAFPTPSRMAKRFDGDDVVEAVQLGEDGMSIRDYFAAHAPPMDDGWASFRRSDQPEHLEPAEEILLRATWSYEWADTMLAVREAQ